MEDNLKGLEAEQMIVDDVSEITYKTIDLGEFGEIEIPEVVDVVAEGIYDQTKVNECIEACAAVFEAYGANLFEVIKICEAMGASAKAILEIKSAG